MKPLGRFHHQLVQRDGARCWLCRAPIEMGLRGTGDPMSPSVDHVIPRSLGGSDKLRNLKLAHRLCNERRGNDDGERAEAAERKRVETRARELERQRQAAIARNVNRGPAC